MNKQIVKAASSIKPALSVLFAVSYVFGFGSFVHTSTTPQADGSKATATYTVAFKARMPSAATHAPVATEAVEVASAKVPGTCDLFQNTLCDDPVAWLKAVVANLLA